MTATDHPLGQSLAIAREANISFRQMDYWTRCGHIHPHPRRPGDGTGVPRTYPPTEARIAVTMARLVRAGIDVRAAATAARRMVNDDTNTADLGHGVTITVRTDT